MRAIPDGYTHNFENLKDSIKKTHTDAEMKRQDTVDAQEHADAWRAGWTPSSGPVLSLAQGADHDQSYAEHFDKLAASMKAQSSKAEAARQDAVDAQEGAD